MSTRLHLIALGCALLTSAACSDADPGPGSGDTSSLPTPAGLTDPAAAMEYRQQAELDGRFVTGINIVGDTWTARGPHQDVTLTFEAVGLSQVRQFELIVQPSPASAFDLSNAAFALATPPWTFSPGVQVLEDNSLRLGGASLGYSVDGTQHLGSLTLKTSGSFNSLSQARIGVLLFSIGPSSQERDNFEAGELNLGVKVD